MTERKINTERKNVFTATDWFDENFFEKFLFYAYF